jgi:hypothetical protein
MASILFGRQLQGFVLQRGDFPDFPLRFCNTYVLCELAKTGAVFSPMLRVGFGEIFWVPVGIIEDVVSDD